MLKALLLTQEEIVEQLQDAGWEVLVWSGEEDILVGHSGDELLILVHELEDGAADPSFELYDGKYGLSYRVRVIPTPRVAKRLLEQHGRALSERAGPASRSSGPRGSR